jgi:hypothetical protein
MNALLLDTGPARRRGWELLLLPPPELRPFSCMAVADDVTARCQEARPHLDLGLQSHQPPLPLEEEAEGVVQPLPLVGPSSSKTAWEEASFERLQKAWSAPRR